MPMFSGRSLLAVTVLPFLTAFSVRNATYFDFLYLWISNSFTMYYHQWLAALATTGLYFQGVAVQPTVTDTNSGVVYFGASSNGVEHFENIYFGQATGGSNRFSPPLPFTYRPGSHVLANVSGPACPQPTDPVAGFEFLFSNVTYQSENCLSLRIARPAGTTPASKLPVMIWLYGGMDQN